MHILVTGAAGVLGGRLAQLLSRSFHVTATSHHSPVPAGLERVAMDLESPASVEAAIAETRPEAVLHAGANAFVDVCEKDPELARRVNVRGSEAVARACAERGLRLVAVSTDLVFAGDQAPYAEAAPTAPLMTYGRTKLQGEDAVLQLCPRGVVARVPLILGRGYGARSTASEMVTWALRAGKRVTLFTDQYRTPCDAEALAPALAALLTGRQTGRFHLGGPERVSRHELGLRVARAHGLPTDLIDAVPQTSRPSIAPRPPDVSFDSGRARRELGYRPRSLDEMLRGDRPGPE
jgi:dTDP-4-dehydrorhamnose reductase